MLEDFNTEALSLPLPCAALFKDAEKLKRRRLYHLRYWARSSQR